MTGEGPQKANSSFGVEHGHLNEGGPKKAKFDEPFSVICPWIDRFFFRIPTRKLDQLSLSPPPSPLSLPPPSAPSTTTTPRQCYFSV